jgi:hypothetical protein
LIDKDKIDSYIIGKTGNFRIANSYFFHLLPLFVKITSILIEEAYLYTKNGNFESLNKALKVLDDLCEMFSWSTVSSVIMSQSDWPQLNLNQEISNPLIKYIKAIFTYKNLIFLLEILRNLLLCLFFISPNYEEGLKLFKTDYDAIEAIQNQINQLTLNLDPQNSFTNLESICEIYSGYNQTPKESLLRSFHSEQMPKVNLNILENFLQNKFLEELNLKINEPIKDFYKKVEQILADPKEIKKTYLQSLKELLCIIDKQKYQCDTQKIENVLFIRNILISSLVKEIEKLEKKV